MRFFPKDAGVRCRRGLSHRKRHTDMPCRTHLIALVVVACAATVPPQSASAQVTRADSAAVLLGTAADLEQRGDLDAAEFLYRFIRDRFGDTPAAATARVWLEAALAERVAGGGETELKVWATTYGIWLGVWVPAAFEADRAEPYGAGLLLGAPGGFLAGRAYSRSRPLSLGQARAITWGGTWGALQGLVLANALDVDTEAIFGMMIAGSGLGLAGGLALARQEIMPGTATSATAGSLWGSWFGAAAAILADTDGDAAAALVMLGGNAGLAAGALAGSRIPLSRSRARLINVGGLIGGVAGLGIALLWNPDNDKTLVGTALAGSVVGLFTGGALTNARPDEEGSDEAAEPAGFAAAGALVNWSKGEWFFAAPLPLPSPSDALTGRGRFGSPRSPRDALVWKVPLLNVRF